MQDSDWEYFSWLCGVKQTLGTGLEIEPQLIALFLLETVAEIQRPSQELKFQNSVGWNCRVETEKDNF